ncbi:hypothetical protein P7K49_026134 [Saguinus oedipus]|uniref:Uncharacterized protein n=1 Tax=Saguinus oedipus TaxID=9490 RepID=A0ABQ9UJ48_SAGOE|nr:hypothetical protein P7K49_026134 [Saguinus oedipus]
MQRGKPERTKTEKTETAENSPQQQDSLARIRGINTKPLPLNWKEGKNLTSPCRLESGESQSSLDKADATIVGAVWQQRFSEDSASQLFHFQSRPPSYDVSALGNVPFMSTSIVTATEVEITRTAVHQTWSDKVEITRTAVHQTWSDKVEIARTAVHQTWSDRVEIARTAVHQTWSDKVEITRTAVHQTWSDTMT